MDATGSHGEVQEGSDGIANVGVTDNIGIQNNSPRRVWWEELSSASRAACSGMCLTGPMV